MNIIDSIRLRTKYSAFKGLNIEDGLLKKIMCDKEFYGIYKSNKKGINEFITFLTKNNTEKENPIQEKDVIGHHIKCLLELSKIGGYKNYTSYIMNNDGQNFKIDNYHIFSDERFEQLYSIFGNQIFDDNISEIVKAGYSDRLILFQKKYGSTLNCSNFISDIFFDKTWDIIYQNDTIGDKKLLDIFNNSYKLKILSEIINNDMYEGLKFTYEQIPESHHFIEYDLNNKRETISIEQFSLDFINNIEYNNLKKLYNRQIFVNKDEFHKVFKMHKAKNYQLIDDCLNFNLDNVHFSVISDDDIDKRFIECNQHHYDKRAIFLNNYLGINFDNSSEMNYIKLFLDSINRVKELPSQFKDRYGQLNELLNMVLYNANEGQLIELAKNMDSQKREYYRMLIESFEKEGNEILKSEFSTDLKSKQTEMIRNIPARLATFSTISRQNVNISIYDFYGEPFTMLVHAISNNNMSIHNEYVSALVKNPSKWETIEDGNNLISTSLITNKYMYAYQFPKRDNSVMYGFADISKDTVKFTKTNDAGIDRKVSVDFDFNMRNMIDIPLTNTVTTIDNLIAKSLGQSMKGYNEIGLLRNDPTTGKKLKPTYIVCVDQILQPSIDAANYFNIPIYLIHTNFYPTPERNKYFENVEQVSSLEETGKKI